MSIAASRSIRAWPRRPSASMLTRRFERWLIERSWDEFHCRVDEPGAAGGQDRDEHDRQGGPNPGEPLGPAEPTAPPGRVGRARQKGHLEQPVAEPAPDLPAGREAVHFDLVPHSGQANDPSMRLVSPDLARRKRLVATSRAHTSRIPCASRAFGVRQALDAAKFGKTIDCRRRTARVGAGAANQRRASAVQWPISQVSTSESIGFVRRWELG